LSDVGLPVERSLLVSLLKLTGEGPVQRGLVGRAARVPSEVADGVLRRFSALGLVQLTARTVEASPRQRVAIALHAVELGADPEAVCRALRWMEFEDVVSLAFEANRFTVRRRFRFKGADRMWEVDVLGLREPLIVSVDCKHWIRGWRRSALARAVGSQVERTRALAGVLPSLRERLELGGWGQARLVPVVLALAPAPLKFHEGVPIVPILQLQDFLNELPAHLTELAQISTRL